MKNSTRDKGFFSKHICSNADLYIMGLIINLLILSKYYQQSLKVSSEYVLFQLQMGPRESRMVLDNVFYNFLDNANSRSII